MERSLVLLAHAVHLAAGQQVEPRALLLGLRGRRLGRLLRDESLGAHALQWKQRWGGVGRRAMQEMRGGCPIVRSDASWLEWRTGRPSATILRSTASHLLNHLLGGLGGRGGGLLLAEREQTLLLRRRRRRGRLLLEQRLYVPRCAGRLQQREPASRRRACFRGRVV